MKKYCEKCVLDDSVSNFHLNEKGICNYCIEHDLSHKSYSFTADQSKDLLRKIAEQIKKDGKNKKYDCILGMSGGVDSSYVAYLAGKLNLRTLVVHVDNGWNSEIAVRNIQKIISKLNFDLYTHVLNWEHFKDLQRAFFFSSVLDIEVAADNAINAIVWGQVSKHGIKHVISGGNFATEHGLPRDWRWDKLDKRNLNHIHKLFGSKKITSHPKISNFHLLLWFRLFRNIKQHLPLNAINYNRTEAVKLLKEEFDWKDYGGKHHESIFTKFYQSYVLPKKFNIDKRKAHLSALIRNKEITKEIALKELSKPLYEEVDLIREKSFILKKLGFSNEDFEKIMSEAPIKHDHYKNEKRIKNYIEKVKAFLK
tara:strand:+ start:16569 stop:17669 length:1101 start_codon:yes stop_codon:yes gene_type:complete